MITFISDGLSNKGTNLCNLPPIVCMNIIRHQNDKLASLETTNSMKHQFTQIFLSSINLQWNCAQIIQKQSMQLPQPGFLKLCLLKLFINRNTTPPYLQIIQLAVESVLYIAVINGFTFSALLPSSNASFVAISLVFAALLLFRILKGLSLVKFVYVPLLAFCIISINTSASSHIAIVFVVILSLLIAVDILSNISFDFYSENLSSESLNINKIAQYATFIFGVAQSVLSDRAALQGISAGCLLAVWFLKRASVCRNKLYKEFQLRAYLWMVASHLTVLMLKAVSISLLAQLAIPLAVSQIAMSVYLKRKGVPKLDELYSQENYLKLAFELMIYIHGETYSAVMDKQIESFLPDTHSATIKENQKRRIIYEKIIEMLYRRASYQQMLISAEIFLFYNHQLLKAKELLEKLKKQTSGLSWMRRICLFRVQETLKEIYLRKNSEIHFAHYEEYYACDDFRALMLKSSLTFVALWEYTRRPEIVSQRFRELSNRLVKIERRLKKNYKEIKLKCLTISLIYVSYLLEVSRDSTLANSILEGLAFNEDFQVNLQLDEKVFVQIALEKQTLCFEKVGANISLLLGYQKKQLQGQKQDVLLPQFYRKSHWGYVTQLFQKQFSKLYLFNKKTIVRNRWGYYQQCNVMLRLHFSDDGELVLRGYIQVKPNLQYCWNNFIFLNQNQEIIQCSENLSDFMPTLSKFHKASEIFKEVSLYKPLRQQLGDVEVQYHPLLVLQAETQKVFYFVRKSRDEEQIPLEKVSELLQKMQLRKFQWPFVKGYYLRLQDLTLNIYAKEYLILGLVGFICVLGLIGCEAYFITDSENQAQKQQSSMALAQNVLSYYDTAITLGMRVNYVDMRLFYDYSNSLSKNNVINISLTLQSVNEQLKGLTANTYSLPSLIPNVTYHKPNYDMIVEFLSNSYMIRQFSDDPFIQSTVLTRARISIYSIFGASIDQYQNNFVASINKDQTQYDDIVVIVVIMVLLLGVCLIILRLELKLRVDQHQALTLLASVQNQEELIGSTKQFISKITQEDLAAIRHEEGVARRNAAYNNSFAPDGTARDVTRSEMSLRQISGRDLLGDSFNRSGVLQTSQTSRLEPQPSVALQSQQLTLTPRKRWLLIITLLFGLTIGGISLSSQINYNIKGKINLYTSITNIFSMFQTGSFFSRSMILFVNLVAMRQAGTVNTTNFDTFMSNYTSRQLIVTFPQSTFDQFQPFQSLLSQVQYQYMCTYIDCDPIYADQINIIYTTTIEKIITSAQTWKGKLNSMTVDEVGSSVKNGSLSSFLNLLYYTQSVIRAELITLTNIYFDCFNDYSNNLVRKKTILMGMVVAATIISFVLLILLTIYVFKQQGYLKDIANLVKTDSYINQDNLISDKQGGKASQ